MRLIDADALLTERKKSKYYHLPNGDIAIPIIDVEHAPTVQPEIIRCKDCKHRDKYGCCKYWKGLAMGDIPIATDDYDFCSMAKRRGDG